MSANTDLKRERLFVYLYPDVMRQPGKLNVVLDVNVFCQFAQALGITNSSQATDPTKRNILAKTLFSKIIDNPEKYRVSISKEMLRTLYKVLTRNENTDSNQSPAYFLRNVVQPLILKTGGELVTYANVEQYKNTLSLDLQNKIGQEDIGVLAAATVTDSTLITFDKSLVEATKDGVAGCRVLRPVNFVLPALPHTLEGVLNTLFDPDTSDDIKFELQQQLKDRTYLDAIEPTGDKRYDPPRDASPVDRSRHLSAMSREIASEKSKPRDVFDEHVIGAHEDLVRLLSQEHSTNPKDIELAEGALYASLTAAQNALKSGFYYALGTAMNRTSHFAKSKHNGSLQRRTLQPTSMRLHDYKMPN